MTPTMPQRAVVSQPDRGSETERRACPDEAARWTVVILARNEAQHIEACLASLPEGVPALVIDHGSIDETAARARALGAQVVPGEGSLGQLRALGLARAQTPWVLFVDADERLRPRAGDHIGRALCGCPAEVDGFSIAFHTWCGRTRLWTGGWGHTRHLRLVRVARAHCDTQRLVHEHLQVMGAVRRLPVLIDHLSFKNVEHAAQKWAGYAQLSAKMLAAGRPQRRGLERSAVGARLVAGLRASWRWGRRMILGAWLQPTTSGRLAWIDAQMVWRKHRLAWSARGGGEVREDQAAQ